MGGTVASLARRGHQVLILDLTNGEPTPHGSPEIRANESQASAAVLGARRITLDMPNRYLTDSIENRKRLAAEIRAFRPHYMFAPFPEDAHPDHIAAGQLCEAARFYAKLTKSDIPGEPCFPRRVIFYFPVHLRLRKEPSFLLDISADLEKKETAMRCYRSQFAAGGKEGLIDLFLNENRYWGWQAGFAAAEPFFQKEIPAFSNWPIGYV
ncbi:MAG: PIG-L family deacetylase [Spirochaetia bacterium]|nr:PIG-L family deacetylase [Spirochaetia bacterium]